MSITIRFILFDDEILQCENVELTVIERRESGIPFELGCTVFEAKTDNISNVVIKTHNDYIKTIGKTVDRGTHIEVMGYDVSGI